MGLIFRNDDINMNTDFFELDNMYSIIRSMFPSCEIWSCVTIFSKKNELGSVYPMPPFKDKPLSFFFDVNLFCDRYDPMKGVKIASHGLWHIDHSNVSRDLQEASIITSCKLLGTHTFVPPFNRWNKETEDICLNNNIKLVKFEEGWKSLEHNHFSPTHLLWYWHSWAYTPRALMDKLKLVAK